MVEPVHPLTFCFDFLCPDSYLAWTLLTQAPAFKQVEVELAPWELYPPSASSPPAGLLPPDSPRWQSLQTRAAAAGVRLVPPARWQPSRLLLRAAAAYDRREHREFVRAGFKAVFVDGVDLTRPGEVLAYLQSEGVDVRPFSEQGSDRLSDERFVESQSRVRALRLRLLPTLIWQDERVAGQLDAYAIKGLIDRMLGN